MGLTGNFGSTGATGAVGPATRVEFGFGADGAPLTYVELTRQISLLQRQNVVVEKAMQWYKREAEEWKALALLLMNPKQAQPAPDVASAMRSPHADGFGACNPLISR